MSDVSSIAKRSGLGLLVALALAACGRQDGVVGSLALDAGAAGAGASGAPATRGFSDDFSTNLGIWEEQRALPGASTAIGVPDAAARDGLLAQLRLPGHPEYGPSDAAGASSATQIGTRERFHFGTYRTRLGFGACDASEETVMAFLGYYNDGVDHDGDGIVDDLEIDAQVSCGQPHLLYLTVYTDDDGEAGPRYSKLSRVIDFASGERFDTTRSSSDQFASAGVDASLQRPELFTPGAWYELGFEWHADSLRFFVEIDGRTADVWTLADAEHVPQQPVYILYNLWHPPLHWYPGEGEADYPASDVLLNVDWVTFEPQ